MARLWTCLVCRRPHSLSRSPQHSSCRESVCQLQILGHAALHLRMLLLLHMLEQLQCQQRIVQHWRCAARKERSWLNSWWPRHGNRRREWGNLADHG